MTYNIHHGYNAEEKPRLDEMAELIIRDQSGIVGLVEVDSVCNRSGGVDQSAVLGKATGMHSAFVRHFPFQGGAYGLALLSKFPINRVENRRLPIMNADDGDSTRAAMFASVQISDKTECLVVLVHLDYRSKESRMRQVATLLDVLKDEKRPVFILGDLNAIPDSDALQLIQEHFVDANRKESNTFPGDNPSKKIDYILVSKKHYRKTLEDHVYPVDYSDHRPIVSKIKLR